MLVCITYERHFCLIVVLPLCFTGAQSGGGVEPVRSLFLQHVLLELRVVEWSRSGPDPPNLAPHCPLLAGFDFRLLYFRFSFWFHFNRQGFDGHGRVPLLCGGFNLYYIM